ncbi:MAG: VWA domain-containing protein [Firmicutes bacterium]|nr:VWA domain-containing protein [Bacillota bacterium]
MIQQAHPIPRAAERMVYTMGITLANKEINAAEISCGGQLTVRLSLAAEPDITGSPTDIVLMLDRSGSMQGEPLASLKLGANQFIDIIDTATDGLADGQIGGGSRIGIVSFADTAAQDTQLITSVAALKDAVDALDADGSTNHSDAFIQATELFDPASANAKVLVLFTDGRTTTGPNAAPFAAAAKALGAVVYVIGLDGDGGIDEEALREWASDPASAYLSITPDAAELAELFANLAENIAIPGATDIVLTDTVAECFRITDVGTPSKGTAELLDNNRLRWSIDELGVSASEGATLEFTVQHNGSCSGSLAVNERIEYSDAEGNIVSFPEPQVAVECDIVITEPCAEVVEVSMEGCSDSIIFDAGELELGSLGRILQLNVRLRDVCPGKRVALAVLLTEAGEAEEPRPRGIKVLTIPAHTEESCRDVEVRCIKFVIPDEETDAELPCAARRFSASFIANYLDHDYRCCTLSE